MAASGGLSAWAISVLHHIARLTENAWLIKILHFENNLYFFLKIKCLMSSQRSICTFLLQWFYSFCHLKLKECFENWNSYFCSGSVFCLFWVCKTLRPSLNSMRMLLTCLITTCTFFILFKSITIYGKKKILILLLGYFILSKIETNCDNLFINRPEFLDWIK